MADTVGLGQQREGRAALVGLVVEGVGLAEFEPGVKGEDLLEVPFGALGDAANLVEDAGQIVVDEGYPGAGPGGGLLPAQARGALEQFRVEVDGACYQFACGRAVLPAALSGIGTRQVDEEELLGHENFLGRVRALSAGSVGDGRAPPGTGPAGWWKRSNHYKDSQ